jgi:hypothetical protein
MENEANFSFVTNATRSFHDDNWRETEAAAIEAWEAAVLLLESRKLRADGAVYHLTMNWRPLLGLHRRHYAAMSYIHKHGFKDLDRRIRNARFPRRSAKIPITARSAGGRNLSGAVESALHDVFLIMNIAVPGCCNFYKAELVHPERKGDLSLSNTNFELCTLPSKSFKRPKAKFLPLRNVISWYDVIRVGATQVPNSPSERALFALLHLAKLDGDLLSVVWIFYALESLLQTRVGENFGSIVKRLTLLLELGSNEIAILRKQMRVLYDMRSSVIHGGFEVIHPMNNDGLDKRAERVFGHVLDAIEYGHAIVVAAIQKMVERQWLQLKFDEVIVGDKHE